VTTNSIDDILFKINSSGTKCLDLRVTGNEKLKFCQEIDDNDSCVKCQEKHAILLLEDGRHVCDLEETFIDKC